MKWMKVRIECLGMATLRIGATARRITMLLAVGASEFGPGRREVENGGHKRNGRCRRSARPAPFCGGAGGRLRAGTRRDPGRPEAFTLDVVCFPAVRRPGLQFDVE